MTTKNLTGWIHKSQLTMKHRSIILKPDYLRKKPELSSKKIAFLDNNVNVSVLKCKVHWCKITLKNRKLLCSIVLLLAAGIAQWAKI